MRAWLVVLLVAAVAQPALAGDAECNYIEISAKSGKEPAIDPELKPLEKKLTKPPFSGWNVFHKLSAGAVPLTKQKSENLKLRAGGASLLLRDRSEKRLELTVIMDGLDGKRVLDVKQAVAIGDWALFVNGSKDGHILALTCK